jgi:heat-inducible transcriptional repressor
MGNLVNARFRGVALNTFSVPAAEELPSEIRLMGWLYKKITVLVKQALVAATETDLYVDGTNHMLAQPEYEHSEKARGVLDALERRWAVFRVLSSTLLGSNVTVVIGSENGFAEMQECSFVASSYSISGRPCGSIGVIGPTRMNYSQAVAAVRFMASNLSELLTSMSLG